MNPSTNLEKAKRLRLLSFAIGTISFLGLVAQLLCASMVKENGFVAKLDFAPRQHHLLLHENRPSSEDQYSDPLRRIVASGLSNARPTQAKKALEFYSSLREEDLSGTKIYADGQGDCQYALVFTFYLENVSADVDESFSFRVSLHDVEPPHNDATHPYSYLRLVVYSNPLDDKAHRHTFFAAANSIGEGTVEGGETDTRECISEYERSTDGESVLRKPLFRDEGEGFCENFRSQSDSIIALPFSLAPRQVMRFSLLAYFEGFDPDCIREAPLGSSLGLTIFIGENDA